MKKLFIPFAAALLVACGGAEETKTEELVEELTEEITKTIHGEDFDATGAMTAEDCMAKFTGDSMVATMTAPITDVCAKKGCWMTLDLGGDKDMHVTFKDYGFFVPKDAAGKTATLTGFAKIDTLDVATLKHYAEDANASQEEIDAITEPEVTYSFEATGVVIEDVKK